MAIPSKKSLKIEKLINAFNPTSRKRIDSIKNNVCIWCGEPANQFRDNLSEREYAISGFCQMCQDKTWGK